MAGALCSQKAGNSGCPTAISRRGPLSGQAPRAQMVPDTGRVSKAWSPDGRLWREASHRQRFRGFETTFGGSTSLIWRLDSDPLPFHRATDQTTTRASLLAGISLQVVARAAGAWWPQGRIPPPCLGTCPAPMRHEMAATGLFTRLEGMISVRGHRMGAQTRQKAWMAWWGWI